MLALALLAPFLMSTLVSLFYHLNRRVALTLFTLLPAGLFVFFYSIHDQIADFKTVSYFTPWVSELGINFSLYVDGLSLLFLFLILGIGTLITLYSWGYLKSKPRLTEFYTYLFMFMGSMMGLVLSNNLILLFIFWELTSLSSFFLIGFNHDRSEARTYSQQAFLVTGAGGLALLAGFIVLGHIAGTYEIQELLHKASVIKSHPLCNLSIVLILLGALTKSAQIPFHFWLPNAMAAPTPVSAYLHSATMVKAGVFLVARLSPIFRGFGIWEDILIFVGIITAFTGAALAIKETDLKKLLAYSTVGSLGILMFLLGLGTAEAIEAAIVYLFVHSLYKGALFMIAGIVDIRTGSRDVRGLSGLSKVMPMTAVAALLAALSMAGFPPLFGFMGKELLYQAKVSSPDAGWIFYVLSIASNMMMVAIAFIVGIEPFSGSRIITSKPVAEGSILLLTGPSFLAFLGVIFSLESGDLIQPILSAAVSNTSGLKQQVILKMWHGFNLVFIFSLLTIAGGLIIFFLRDYIRQLAKAFPPPHRYSPEALYFKSIEVLLYISKWSTHVIQSGFLSRYIMLSIFFTTTFIYYTFRKASFNNFQIFSIGMSIEIVVLLGVVMTAAVVSVLSKSKILSASCMGFIGFGLAVVYAFYGAPDIALTQILVETLSVVLIVFLISKFPSDMNSAFRRGHLFKILVAVSFGVLMFILTLTGMNEQDDREAISKFFVENSLTLAHGKNIVNVILVDFRAFDTLGEVTVIMMAAVGVIVLLRRGDI